MWNKKKKVGYRSGLQTSRIAYWTIRLMHDNPILPLVRNPYTLLKAAGLEKGQKVMEIGCGPGFYTIPAAMVVGEEGHVFAVDIHPRAVARVERKIEKDAFKNITPLCMNASDTGFPGGSLDLAFLFGLHYIAGGVERLISEVYRILRSGAKFSVEMTRGSQAEWMKKAEEKGFTYRGKRGRILLFEKAFRGGKVLENAFSKVAP